MNTVDMIYCMMREETKDTHKPPQIKKVALDVFRGYFFWLVKTMFNYYGNKWKKKRLKILRMDGYV